MQVKLAIDEKYVTLMTRKRAKIRCKHRNPLRFTQERSGSLLQSGYTGSDSRRDRCPLGGHKEVVVSECVRGTPAPACAQLCCPHRKGVDSPLPLVGGSKV